MGKWTKTTKISAESNCRRIRYGYNAWVPLFAKGHLQGETKRSVPSRPSDIIVSVRHRIHNFLLLLPPRLLSRISSSHRTISRSNSISLSVPCLALPCLPLSCSSAISSLLGCQGWWVGEMLLLLLLSQFPCFYKMRCSACTTQLNVYPNTNVIAVLLLPPQVLYCAKFCFWTQ